VLLPGIAPIHQDTLSGKRQVPKSESGSPEVGNQFNPITEHSALDGSIGGEPSEIRHREPGGFPVQR